MLMNNCDNNLLGLTLSEIAWWSLPEDSSLRTSGVEASLPALQRGSVWKPHQVERLWDSLARGLPIGAFLLSAFNPDRGNKQLTVGGARQARRTSKPDPTYHL